MMNGKRPLLAAVAALAAILGLAGAAHATENPLLVQPGVDEVTAEIAELESWWASEEVGRLDFRATSEEQAREFIGLAAEACLDPDGPLAELKPAARTELAVQVVRGLESSKFRETVRTFTVSGKLARDKSLIIASRQDAAELGALIGETGLLVLRLTGGQDDPAADQVARKIFSDVAVDTESGVPLLRQYLFAVRDYAGLPDDRLGSLLKINDR